VSFNYFDLSGQERVFHTIDNNVICIISAPAGSGKTTMFAEHYKDYLQKIKYLAPTYNLRNEKSRKGLFFDYDITMGDFLINYSGGILDPRPWSIEEYCEKLRGYWAIVMDEGLQVWSMSQESTYILFENLKAAAEKVNCKIIILIDRAQQCKHLTILDSLPNIAKIEVELEMHRLPEEDKDKALEIRRKIIDKDFDAARRLIQKFNNHHFVSVNDVDKAVSNYNDEDILLLIDYFLKMPNSLIICSNFDIWNLVNNIYLQDPAAYKGHYSIGQKEKQREVFLTEEEIKTKNILMPNAENRRLITEDTVVPNGWGYREAHQGREVDSVLFLQSESDEKMKEINDIRLAYIGITRHKKEFYYKTMEDIKRPTKQKAYLKSMTLNKKGQELNINPKMLTQPTVTEMEMAPDIVIDKRGIKYKINNMRPISRVPLK